MCLMTPYVYVYTCVRTIGAGKATSASGHVFLRTYMEQEAIEAVEGVEIELLFLAFWGSGSGLDVCRV